MLEEMLKHCKYLENNKEIVYPNLRNVTKAVSSLRSQSILLHPHNLDIMTRVGFTQKQWETDGSVCRQ